MDPSGDVVYTLQKEQANDDFLRLVHTSRTQANERLIAAVDKGDIPLSLDIIKIGGLDVEFRGMGGTSALHYASRRGLAAVVLALLKCGFNADAKNDSGETALHHAVYYGHLLIVELLLDNGANINAVNNYNETPLIYAAQKSMPAVVRILLLRGADVTIKDRYGDGAAEVVSDARTAAMFQTATVIESRGSLPYDQVVHVFSFLNAREIAKASMVCGKWHRASECEELWARLGVRRWEFALQSSLGFGPTATASFRPKASSKKKAPTTIFKAFSL
jgi:hypothetical protein